MFREDIVDMGKKLIFTNSQDNKERSEKERKAKKNNSKNSESQNDSDVGMAVSEKVDFMEAVVTRDTEIEPLQAEINKLVLGRGELARGRLELEVRCVQLEEEKANHFEETS